MKRRAFLKGVVTSLAGWASPAPYAPTFCPASEIKRPDTSGMNLLFVHVGGLTAGAVGCYGNQVVKTPNLDRFATGATRFTRCYCQSPMPCLSRASLLTGLRPDATGVPTTDGLRDCTVSAETPLLPELLCRYGFHTVRLTDSDAAFCDEISETPCCDGSPCAGERQADERRGRRAADVLAGMARKGAPFFLSVGFSEPHVRRRGLETCLDLYDADNISMPPTFGRQDRDIPAVAIRFGRNDCDFGDAAASPTTEQTTREAMLTHYACVSFVDAQIGSVLDALDRVGLSNDTIVMLFGECGFHLGEHGLWGPGTLFEQVTRVPLLVRVPGLAVRQAVCEEIVEVVDLLPTVCDLLTIPMPGRLEGKSFVPLLCDPRQPWKRAAFTLCEMPGHVGRSVRTKRWRYTDWQSSTTLQRQFELYDLDSDPWEQINLALHPDYRNERTILANLLQRGWQAAQ